MKLEAIDIFCGAGGLSLGLQRAGIKVIAGIDNDPECRFPYETNIRAPFIEADVNRLSSAELINLYSPDAIRILAGCAPCQPFSGYAAAHGKLEDKRVDLLMTFHDLVRDVRPDIVTLENVARLIYRPIWNEFTAGLNRLGYYSTWQIVDASQYGVPQYRRRLVLLASKREEIKVPVGQKSKATSVRDILRDLPTITAGGRSSSDPLHAARVLTPINLERIRMSKPGGTWRDWPEALRAACHMKKGGKTYPSVYGRMTWDAPAPTITTQFYGFGNGRFGHPEQDRALTLREGAMLQSFPKDFKFHDSRKKVNFRSIGRLIGNAVPPLLGEAIGRSIADHAKNWQFHDTAGSK